MKRSAPLKRYRHINRRSARYIAYNEELEMMKPFVHARAHGRCEFPGCGKPLPPETTPHHRKMRSQGGSNSMVNLWLLCVTHHRRCHTDSERYDRGWLIRQSDPEVPFV